MKQVPIKLGPLALLLAVVSICLTTLAILTFATARADLRLAEKYADTVSTRYALERQGQEFLRELSETDRADWDLMGWEPDADGICRESFEQDGTVLEVGFRATGGKSFEVVSWRIEKTWTEDESIGELWDGGF
jgi:hypothetical protein